MDCENISKFGLQLSRDRFPLKTNTKRHHFYAKRVKRNAAYRLLVLGPWLLDCKRAWFLANRSTPFFHMKFENISKFGLQWSRDRLLLKTHTKRYYFYAKCVKRNAACRMPVLGP